MTAIIHSHRSIRNNNALAGSTIYVTPPHPILALNPKAYWEAGQGITTSGSSVTLWADQTGNGHDAVGHNTTLDASAANGMDAVHFGVGAWMDISQVGAGVATPNGYTVFAYTPSYQPPSNWDIWFDSEYGDAVLLGALGKPTIYVEGNNGFTAPTLPTGQPAIVMGLKYPTGTTHPTYNTKGLTLSTQGAYAANHVGNPAAVVSIGSKRSATYSDAPRFSFGEAIVFDRALTVAEYESVFTYLESKFGVPAHL